MTTVLVYESRSAAVDRIGREPAASRRRMVPLFSGAVDGWVIEWRRAAGGMRALTDRGWVDVWRSGLDVSYGDAGDYETP